MQKKLFFCFSHGNLAEFLKILHELKSGLACACASGLVALNYLSLSVYLEGLDVRVDFFYKCFHKKIVLKLLMLKCQKTCAS